MQVVRFPLSVIHKKEKGLGLGGRGIGKMSESLILADILFVNQKTVTQSFFIGTGIFGVIGISLIFCS